MIQVVVASHPPDRMPTTVPFTCFRYPFLSPPQSSSVLRSPPTLRRAWARGRGRIEHYVGFLFMTAKFKRDMYKVKRALNGGLHVQNTGVRLPLTPVANRKCAGTEGQNWTMHTVHVPCTSLNDRQPRGRSVWWVIDDDTWCCCTPSRLLPHTGCTNSVPLSI